MTTCPAGINVQGYVQLIGQGKYRQAVQLIMERLPLPGVLGRVCPHPCETQCRRAEIDTAVAIRNLKRFAADQVDLSEMPLPDITERKEKVAVVGSGPAGLTVAYYLKLKGYQITVFEELEVLGGMLRVGIPDYRLPPDILDREIGHLLRHGITVQTGKRLGRDFTLTDLEQQGFDAVFLAIGAHLGLGIGIAGEDEFDGVINAIDFLREVNLGSRRRPGDKVVVVGGGNVAVDAARVAKRLGSESVSIVYRRSREEMPAYAEEIEDALSEGVQIYYLTAPSRIVGKDGRVTGFECIRTATRPAGCQRTTSSRAGRGLRIRNASAMRSYRPSASASISTGRRTGLESMPPGATRSGFIRTPCKPRLPYVFAAGDAVSGPASVIEAVAAGHKAVAAIERFFDGEDLDAYAAEMEMRPPPGTDWADIPGNIHPELRVQSRHLGTAERISSFAEVDCSFTEADARREAQRCLNCGICCECMACVDACEAVAIDHGMAEQEVQVKVGSIILATGYDTMDPTPMKPFGYGIYPNVFTALEFERLSNATGPTGGKIRIRDENGALTRSPRSVALLHCIGSRDVNYHEYCSRVCCMYALKYTHLIKEKVGHDTKVYDFYIDMRCFGKGYEEFYHRCQEEGTIFIRGKVAEITDQAKRPEEQGKLIAIAEDTLLSRRVRVPVDMVVLCTAIEARHDAGDVGRLFGVNQGADGFFLEEHPKLGPLNTATDGVFLAGCCSKPMDIPDTVSQASGAAAKALSLATLGKVEVPPTISWIDPDICVGCQVCIGLCPYGAIEFNERMGVSEVNPAVCKGCGSCSGFCPSDAALSRHFKSQQIFAEIDGMMDAIAKVGR